MHGDPAPVVQRVHEQREDQHHEAQTRHQEEEELRRGHVPHVHVRLDDVRVGEEGHHGDEEGGQEGGQEEEQFAEAVVRHGQVVFVAVDVGAFQDGGQFFGVGREVFEVGERVLSLLRLRRRRRVDVKGAAGAVGAAGADAVLGGVVVVDVVVVFGAVGVAVGDVVVAVVGALGVRVDARAAVRHDVASSGGRSNRRRRSDRAIETVL